MFLPVHWLLHFLLSIIIEIETAGNLDPGIYLSYSLGLEFIPIHVFSWFRVNPI